MNARLLTAWLGLMLLGGCIVPLEVIGLVPDGGFDAGFDAGFDGGFDAGFDEGDGGTLTGASDLNAATSHSCAIVRGRIACWGSNASGQLGKPASPKMLPVWQSTVTDWKRVIAGDSSTCGLKTDGSLWCWGSNANGQLGNGTLTPTEVPQRVLLAITVSSFTLKFNTACAVLADATAWCWGANFEGQVGLEDNFDAPDQPTPQAVKKTGGWSQLSAAQGHTCGIRTDGSLWCWGRNTDAQLGLGPGAPGQQRIISQVGTDTDWLEVDCGQGFTCARKNNNALWCWGTTIPGPVSNVPVLVAGAADWSTITVNTFTRGGLRTGGTWWSWGRNWEGQLGLGTISESVDVPTVVGSGYSRLSIGRFHTCAMKDGEVFCTGDNGDGQLGTGTGRLNVPTPVLRPTTR